ncbi:hypothetical protein A7K93_06290 [Candidatus Methylacidiphilum fumarolicum]|jgi:hypothetical protein|uniref:Uncharacterized protein n=2 Tax=Candidatus Methylacidiphilum fumarolicum TaxID=591154 RepID=I0K0N3_METFB|nr:MULTISPECIES: hypothetical protein [Methylacidiphilum (ex Ratnadevi et al. 2023)]MBW6415504.1 hypothetical protein [Candidatus Methylacidiphilum fumarolicum]TFE67986.1 hypothetical protein A7Q09_07720 [Methylacidiphilum sp. Yel]TFE68107.1 hypothetical protein A7K73_07865 [Candidatus Methylacidiphilum fumarolicum]TFE73474.1 hypothetical protein A7K93_06290 [Candidatus Methylacidiphilum fumarolicum]TFE74359.1 hypothetical protein A7K72_04210 [Candidatus Methylacidiphilum fumarolicum]
MLDHVTNPQPPVNNNNLHIIGLLMLCLICGVMTVTGDHLLFSTDKLNFWELLEAFPIALLYILLHSRREADLVVFLFEVALLSFLFLGLSNFYSRFIGTPKRIWQMVKEGEFQAELKQKFTDIIRAKKGM